MFVLRRTDIGTAGHPGEAALRSCAHLLAKELGWSAQRQERELEEVQSAYFHEKPGAARPEIRGWRRGFTA